MAFIKDFIEKQTFNRRNFLLASAYGLGGAVAASAMGARAARAAIPDPTIAWSYRDRSNSYWNAIVAGGDAFVESLGKPKSALINLINGGSSEKSLADVKALLAKTNGKLALAIDPNDSPNCRPVVEAVQGAGAYASTIWNKPDDIHPWQFGDNWVSHTTWSDVGPSEQTADILFKAMGGHGGIVQLGGIASNSPAIQRLQGLHNALAKNPGIKLLDAQPADWDTQKAYALMEQYITRYGDEIKGVHCANDTIAFGVLQALKDEGITGMPVVSYDGTPEAVQLVIKGDILATVSTDPFWGGGIAASLAYHAAIGTFKPSAEPHAHREFYGPTILITHDDALKFQHDFIDHNPTYNWSDFWSQSQGPVKYS